MQTIHHYPQQNLSRCSLSHQKIVRWLGDRGIWFNGAKLLESCNVFLHVDGWLFIRLKEQNECWDSKELITTGDDSIVVIHTHKYKKNGMVKEINDSCEATRHISLEEFLNIACELGFNPSSPTRALPVTEDW